jgi:uncharacterized caspase-like protein
MTDLHRFPAAALAIALAFGALFAAGPALAQKRLALVVGNNAYPNLGADKQLNNAIGDARAVRETLKGLGFEVLHGENLDRRALIDRLFDFTARLGKDDTAFFSLPGTAFRSAAPIIFCRRTFLHHARADGPKRVGWRSKRFPRRR